MDSDNSSNSSDDDSLSNVMTLEELDAAYAAMSARMEMESFGIDDEGDSWSPPPFRQTNPNPTPPPSASGDNNEKKKAEEEDNEANRKRLDELTETMPDDYFEIMVIDEMGRPLGNQSQATKSDSEIADREKIKSTVRYVGVEVDSSSERSPSIISDRSAELAVRDDQPPPLSDAAAAEAIAAAIAGTKRTIAATEYPHIFYDMTTGKFIHVDDSELQEKLTKKIKPGSKKESKGDIVATNEYKMVKAYKMLNDKCEFVYIPIIDEDDEEEESEIDVGEASASQRLWRDVLDDSSGISFLYTLLIKKEDDSRPLNKDEATVLMVEEVKGGKRSRNAQKSLMYNILGK